ncbi:lipid phosphate phosphatase delta isoform X1 [Tripterygium wilfordii]|uniref:Lipid phosphate phosphatase delta isoform X1 n=1 Tax=Tripterygium wilfordii TaxID=458696 RepID=A0A7J7DMZ5_TRIWF|nr:lipid phosphate phosphatase delta-like [Tripterygium wilfordii]KAF5747740.1 lipid phosphate phosphatase delta isoform X1 [Tripterygium wilfordii]
MESTAAWQGVALCGFASWIVTSSCLNVTPKLRSLVQPWVEHRVIAETPLIIQIQKYRFTVLDALFSGLSCIVSVPFYTAFLPLLFWSGHGKLARQMTLLMVFCDYLGNCVKDVISAPRPSSPPVRRVAATKDEEENALEYGLPSSHTLNTVCLSGYLLHYVLSYSQNEDALVTFAGIFLVSFLVGLIGFGRIYLGMHSLIDIIGGLALGLVTIPFWLSIHDFVDSFIVSGQNVTTFWTLLSFLLLFAYPTPEFPTPSFEYHTAFNGVGLGIVAGVQQTYHQYHHEAIPRIFTPELTIPAFIGRMLVGIPTILAAKFCSKALAKWILPVVSNTLGIPIKSPSYIPALNGSVTGKKTDEIKQSSYLRKMFFFSHQDSFDVDTGIRFIQYAGLAWAVVDLVPTFFSYLRL